MKIRAGAFGVGVLLAVVIAACVGDEQSVTGGDAGGGGPGQCTDAQKSCNGSCVSKDDPVVGCATADCAPCAPAINAAPACKDGACAFSCNAGFSDCDGDPSTGCEAKTSSDAANCGACGKACGAANTDAATKCEAGKCVFACKKGFGHCAGADDAGCETDLLTSGEHCGACGHSCLGGQCVGGACQPFKLASASFPRGVAVDAKDVYFTIVSPDPSIKRVKRDGTCSPASPCPQEFAGSSLGDGTGPTLGFRGPVSPFSDGARVYWINQAGSKVATRPAAGGAMTFLGGSAGSADHGYLAVAGGKVFWTNAFAGSEPTPHVYRANLDGTNVETVATYANPATTFRGHGGIAADATHIFWASQNSGIFRAAFADPPCVESTTCASPVTSGGASSPFGVAVDESFVYWTEATGVRKAPKGGGASTAVATNQDTPRAIAVLGGFVYWANTGGSLPSQKSIRRAPQSAATCDGAACELVAPVAVPDALVAADDGIYWSDNSQAGGVYRLAR